MKLGFGKFRGRMLASIVASEPDYLLWMLGVQQPSSRIVELRAEARRLIHLVNHTPWAVLCSCGSTAIHAEVKRFGGVLSGLEPVCDDCSTRTRWTVETYGDSVKAGSTKGDRKLLAREYLRLKGLRPRGHAAMFFRMLGDEARSARSS